MPHKIYLKVVLGLLIIDSVFFTYLYSALRDSSAVPILLGARIVVDLALLAIGLRYIKLTGMEFTLILMVFLSCIFASIPGSYYSSVYSIGRFFNDSLGPVIFILKVSLLRTLFFRDINSLNIVKLTRILIYISIFQVSIFLFFSAQTGAYAGITPPVNIPAAFYIASSNYTALSVVVIIVLLSGKRSFLISIGLVAALAIYLRRSRHSTMAFFTMACSLLLLISIIPNEKINMTIDSFNNLIEVIRLENIDFSSDNFRSALYLLTAGRSEELYGILINMNSFSWLIGLGPGFTYEFQHLDSLVVGYANSHFSPLSLTYKFGLIFTLFFYIYLTNTIHKLLKIDNFYSLTICCALSIFLIQSIFAFNLFSEPYFPILLALGMAIIKISKKNGDHLTKI